MALLRFLRLALLVGSVLLTPQLQLAHALSHSLPAPAGAPAAKERQAHADRVCDTCLAFAQLDAAIPVQFDWSACRFELPPAAPLRASPLPATIVRAFQARGPPDLHA